MVRGLLADDLSESAKTETERDRTRETRRDREACLLVTCPSAIIVYKLYILSLNIESNPQVPSQIVTMLMALARPKRNPDKGRLCDRHQQPDVYKPHWRSPTQKSRIAWGFPATLFPLYFHLPACASAGNSGVMYMSDL